MANPEKNTQPPISKNGHVQEGHDVLSENTAPDELSAVRMPGYTISADHVSFVDSHHPESKMEARSTGSMAHFDIDSRIPSTSAPSNEPVDKDIQRVFIGFALKTFEQQGTKIETCRGIWYRPDPNFYTFQKALKEYGVKALAAQATTEGTIFTEFGFTQIEEKNVVIHGRGNPSDSVDIRDDSLVSADFSKPAAPAE